MDKLDFNTQGVEFSIYKDDNVWGDGKHESTKHMMNFIGKYGVKNKSVIDIGTGTGILSVLCGKLGASSILALDISPYSIEWARKNFKRNNIEAEAEVNDLTRYMGEKADVILANLPGPIQVENVKTVARHLNEDGLLIMTWWNRLAFEDFVRGFIIVDYVKGVDYDAYVLKKAW